MILFYCIIPLQYSVIISKLKIVAWVTWNSEYLKTFLTFSYIYYPPGQAAFAAQDSQTLHEASGSSLIWNCGTPTAKTSEFLESEHKSVMQEGSPFVKDSSSFIIKPKSTDHIPQDAIMVTADVIGLYTSISHDAGLEVLRKALDNREKKKISVDDLIKMTEICFKKQLLSI